MPPAGPAQLSTIEDSRVSVSERRFTIHAQVALIVVRFDLLGSQFEYACLTHFRTVAPDVSRLSTAHEAGSACAAMGLDAAPRRKPDQKPNGMRAAVRQSRVYVEAQAGDPPWVSVCLSSMGRHLRGGFMSRAVIRALQIALGLAFLLLVLAQVVILPGLAEDSARRFPEAVFLRTPLLVLAVSTLICVQVAVVCVGKLLTMAGQQRILDPASYPYVDVCIGATVMATALVMGVGVFVSSTVGSPLWVSCTFLAVVGTGIARLMVVTRGRLRQATQRHSEFAAVV